MGAFDKLITDENGCWGRSISYMNSNIRADKPINPGKINEGDVMLYGENCIVLFYNNLNTSYSYIKLGHINNTDGLDKDIG